MATGVSSAGGYLKSGLTEGGQVAAAAVIGGTVSEMSGGKFANGAISAAFNETYGTNAEYKRNHFAGNEKEIRKLLIDSGAWNGKDDIVFFGERPLNGTGGAYVKFIDSLNIDAVHEHAFGFENGKFVNIGFTGARLGVAQDPHLTSDLSGYVFNKTIYQGGLTAASNLIKAGSYNLFRNNCQDFADSMRAKLSP